MAKLMQEAGFVLMSGGLITPLYYVKFRRLARSVAERPFSAEGVANLEELAKHRGRGLQWREAVARLRAERDPSFAPRMALMSLRVGFGSFVSGAIVFAWGFSLGGGLLLR